MPLTDKVIDVSREPHIEDLMLASDLLISDYSSIFFDYLLLGNPMLAYVPDLMEYELERGLSCDLPKGVKILSTRVLSATQHETEMTR